MTDKPDGKRWDCGTRVVTALAIYLVAAVPLTILEGAGLLSSHAAEFLRVVYEPLSILLRYIPGVVQFFTSCTDLGSHFRG